MHFGFSYVGLIFLTLLMVPNLIWTKNQPKDYEKYAVNENKILLAFERVGEVLVSCLALIFSDFNLKPWLPWNWWLIAAFAMMVLYEIYWIRYFRSDKTMKDFYSSILGIPVAGATLPVLAFMLLAIYGRNAILGAAVIILGIGHIGIHLMHRKESFLHGDHTERYCRNGEEIGDIYKCTYGCPVNKDGYGICSKTMMMLYPLMEAVRSGGDLSKVGGDGEYSKTVVCPDGCVIFKLTAKPLGNENFHTGGFWDYPDET